MIAQRLKARSHESAGEQLRKAKFIIKARSH